MPASVGAAEAPECLGEGADAVVYLDARSDVVVKKHHLASTYLRELRALRALQAPEIVRLVAFCISDQVLYLQRHDCDLLQVLARGEAGSESAGGRERFQHLVCTSLLRALARCHAAGVAHNDVKLENLLVRRRPLSVVLADFGRASFPEEQPSVRSAIKGTRTYMAPEVFVGQACLASDCWSAGVVAFACVELQMPFEEEDGSGPLVYQLAEKQRPWPRWATALVDALLVPEPERRLGAREALALLDGLQRGDAAGPQASSPPPPALS
jgi:serine/threonine protein kinase